MTPSSLKLLVREFSTAVGAEPSMPPEYEASLAALCEHLDGQQLRSKDERRCHLLASINQKFRFNRDLVAAVYALAAKAGVTFNYHQKCEIQEAFDQACRKRFSHALAEAAVHEKLAEDLMELFQPVSEEETLKRFREELLEPSKLRKAKGDRDIQREILLAALSAYVFRAAEPQVLHAHFDSSYDPEQYEESFWLQLRRMHPDLYNRERALVVYRLSAKWAATWGDYSSLRSSAIEFVAENYRTLNNHGHLAIWLDPMPIGGRSVQWELASDIMLFAEKHDEVELRKMYFRRKRVEQETTAAIPGVNTEAAKFHLANEGFTYRDTFVCAPHKSAPLGQESLLVLLQKNQRDETLIPCPACRSHKVQGNSYPSLGVRSWECKNPLCPDRSKYNRGKRYSFRALLMQEAINDENNEVPVESVRGWARDVQVGRDFPTSLDMLIRHYSLFGDTVHVYGHDDDIENHGRDVIREPLVTSRAVSNRAASDDFWSSAWFARYAVEPNENRAPDDAESIHAGRLHLVRGDARRALRAFPDGYFDAAVTSPPYYNAKEYAQWPNIYCHLHDMYWVARECFRVLKPGTVYLYNVFDYFDNEHSIVFSAMGNKRLILSAYTVDLFRRAGFTCAGSVTWDKGEIEGKRGFNAGNFSPYYQAPFNCWEHVLVFVKPREDGELPDLSSLPAVLRAQPVTKMVRGENTYGHTAPFPQDIPSLLDAVITTPGRILDPFGGSGTTARALTSHQEVVCVERQDAYCELALRMFRQDSADQGGPDSSSEEGHSPQTGYESMTPVSS